VAAVKCFCALSGREGSLHRSKLRSALPFKRSLSLDDIKAASRYGLEEGLSRSESSLKALGSVSQPGSLLGDLEKQVQDAVHTGGRGNQQLRSGKSLKRGVKCVTMRHHSAIPRLMMCAGTYTAAWFRPHSLLRVPGRTTPLADAATRASRSASASGARSTMPASMSRFSMAGGRGATKIVPVEGLQTSGACLVPCSGCGRTGRHCLRDGISTPRSLSCVSVGTCGLGSASGTWRR
jgi:hypothetical protein